MHGCSINIYIPSPSLGVLVNDKNPIYGIYLFSQGMLSLLFGALARKT